jgi:hypothetical protein
MIRTLSLTLDFDIFPPVMHVLVSKHLPNLSIAQRCFELSHFPRDLCSRIILRQEILRCSFHSNGIIRSVEDLESQSALLDGKVADLAQVTSVNVTPRVPLS